MAVRKSLSHPAPPRPELERLLERARETGVSDEDLREQRVSFAFGNAPAGAERITKELARATATRNRLLPA